MSLRPKKDRSRVPKRKKNEVERKIRRQQTRTPFTWSTGASDIIKVWSNKKNGYIYYEYYTSRNDKEKAQGVAKGLRLLGIKARVRKKTSVIEATSWNVYQEIELI